MDHGTSRTRICGDAHETALWKARASDLAALCAASAPCEEAERLDEAMALLAQPRLPEGLAVAHAAGEPGLAATIAAGGALSAAVALLGERAGYLISRGPGGVCMATVVLDGSGREESAEGTTPALAVLGAHLGALLAQLDTRRFAAGRTARPPSMRLN